MNKNNAGELLGFLQLKTRWKHFEESFTALFLCAFQIKDGLQQTIESNVGENFLQILI